MSREISVLIPASNEAEHIKENVMRLDNFLRKIYGSYEIIISEDGSTDGTDRILKSISNKRIKHIHFKNKLGKGQALKNAFFSSSGKIILTLDADFPMDIYYIPNIVSFLEFYDMVIGSRLMKRSITKRSYIRSLFSISYNTFVRILFRTGIRDHQCGVKAFKREVLSEVLSEIISIDFFWDTELIVRSKNKMHKILEVPIEWKDRNYGKSKVSFYKESIRMGKNLLFYWNLSRKTQ